MDQQAVRLDRREKKRQMHETARANVLPQARGTASKLNLIVPCNSYQITQPRSWDWCSTKVNSNRLEGDEAEL